MRVRICPCALPEKNLHGSRVFADLIVGIAQIGAHLCAAHHSRTRGHTFEPSFEIGKIVDVLTLPLPIARPSPRGHVRNRIIAGEIITAHKLLIHYAVKPVDLVGIAADRIGNLFRRVAAEMVGLSGHWPEPTDLPEQPLVDLDPAAFVLGIKLAGLAPEILQNGAGFENRDRLASRTAARTARRD